MTSILVLHGPNLNLLGTREPEVYGSASLSDYVHVVRSEAAKHGLSVSDIQSNSESNLVDAIHAAKNNHQAIIINAGAFTHYSWAIHDALRSFDGHVIEVHISNPGAREEFRHVSVLSTVVDGTIAGFGALGYSLAVNALVALGLK
jgi:3-dehydroquinate dehydratase-2